MDQQSFYYGKHNIGSQNYQTAFGTSDSEYQTTAYSDHSQNLHSTGLTFNSSGIGTAGTYSDATNLSAVTSSTSSTSSSSRAATNSNLTTNHSTATDLNTVPHNRLYPFISESSHGITQQNLSSTAQNDGNNLVYGGGAFSSNNKTYENSTGSAQVPVIAATNNSLQSSGYHSNINYGAYQNVDYSLHKSMTQNYSTNLSMPVQNRNSLNAAPTAFTTNLSSDQLNTVNKNRSSAEVKTSAKTSVIKPLNAYSAPINYAKYAQPYPAYPTSKNAATYEKPLTNSSRSAYNTSNHKNSDVFCLEPISARYANSTYPINVCASSTGHTSSSYLANSYHLGYGHHLPQHQSTVHHGRGLLPTAGYSAQLNESADYLNRQHGLVLRPTPNTYKQCQIPYQSPYATYTRHDSNSGTSNIAIPKPQPQKPVDDTMNSLGFNDTYDRRRQYSSVYGTNYMDSANDFQQYSNFTNLNASTFYPPKASTKLFYNYNAGLSMYGNSNSQLVAQNSQQSTSIPTTTTTTTVQQPVAINPNSTQLISSNYDASSLHTHSMIPPPLFNSNTGNSSKDYCPTNQYQQSSYASQILYPPLQSGNYLSASKTNLPTIGNYSNHSSYEKPYSDKLLAPPPLTDKQPICIDLEEQIISSKITKRSLASRTKSTEFDSLKLSSNDLYGNQYKMHHHHHPTLNLSANSTSNKNQYIYNYDAFSNCYQQQQTHQPLVTHYQSNWQKPHTVQPSTSAPIHLHPKKQSLRDFLSSWNEDEEEETDAMSKKWSNKCHNDGSATQVIDKELRFDRHDKASNNTSAVIVQPTPQLPHATTSHLKSALMLPTYHDHSVATTPSVVTTTNTPTIHVGITVDNGTTQNLPDIIIDIEKPKVAGESECFERANVIQGPKLSEKLYILDSMDIPLSDLNKYRHLNVVNKLPDNIVLPPPPPLKHEDNDSLKFIDDVALNQSRPFKNDFEMNAIHDEDLVECKNTSINMQKVKRIIKKYRRQREYMRKTKNAPSTLQPSLAVPNETNSNLSTPLKSLSPVQEYNDDMLLSATCPVDLSVNNKECMDDFIDNFSICSDGSGDFDLDEIMNLTASPPSCSNHIDVQKDIQVVRLEEEAQLIPDRIQCEEAQSKQESVQCDEVQLNMETAQCEDTNPKQEDVQCEEAPPKLESVQSEEAQPEQESVQSEEAQPERESVQCEETQPEPENVHYECSEPKSPLSTVEIESLQSMCIRTFNSDEFRNIFSEIVKKAENDDENLISPKNFEDNFFIDDQKSKEIGKSPSVEDPLNELVCEVEQQIDECENLESSSNDVIIVESSTFPTLRRLATAAVERNLIHLAAIFKASKHEFDSELQQRKFIETDANIDANVNRVKSLKELAREVANTIYSFNVKPLKDICTLAIEKYNHLYLVNRISVPNQSEDSREDNQIQEKMEAIQEDIEPAIEAKELLVPEPMETHEETQPVIVSDDLIDDGPVKSLKILAQICVDELNEMQRNSPKKSENCVYISSDSDSDESSDSTESETMEGNDDDDDDKNESSESDSSSSSDNDSSSESSSSSDEEEDNESETNIPEPKTERKTDIEIRITEPTPEKEVEPQIVEDKVVDESMLESQMSSTSEYEECLIEEEIDAKSVHEKEETTENVTAAVLNECDQKSEIANVLEDEVFHEKFDSKIENKSEAEPTKAIEDEETHVEPDSTSEQEIEQGSQPMDISEDEECYQEPETTIYESYNPTPLKDLCKDVLDAHSMILRYEVPSLKYLCEHTMTMAGMEVPMICFVNEDEVNALETTTTFDQSSHDEEVYYCLDSEFDETELANLFNAAEDANPDSTEFDETNNNGSITDEASLIEQCVALENILSSPPYEQNSNKGEVNDGFENVTEECVYFMDDHVDQHHNIQYEETVVPAEIHTKSKTTKVITIKKNLQLKYVQAARCYKMLTINRTLKKYLKYFRKTSNKKLIVRKRLQETIATLKKKAEERRKPKIPFRRRSARLADKYKLNFEEFDEIDEIEELKRPSPEKEKEKPKVKAKEKEKGKSKEKVKQKPKDKVKEKPKPKEKEKKEIVHVKRKINGFENHKSENPKPENPKLENHKPENPKPENPKLENHKPEKSLIMKLDRIPKKSKTKIEESPETKAETTNNNVHEISDRNKAPFKAEILQTIARKRSLKRQLSVCERPILRSSDDFCYDEDGQISEMVSSFINNSFDDLKFGSLHPPPQKKRAVQNYTLTEFCQNADSVESKNLRSVLKQLPSIETPLKKESLVPTLRPNQQNTSPKEKSMPPEPEKQSQPQQVPLIQTRSVINNSRVPPPRRKSCSAGEWMMRRSHFDFPRATSPVRRYSPPLQRRNQSSMDGNNEYQQHHNNTMRINPFKMTPQMKQNQNSPKMDWMNRSQSRRSQTKSPQEKFSRNSPLRSHRSPRNSPHMKQPQDNLAQSPWANASPANRQMIDHFSPTRNSPIHFQQMRLNQTAFTFTTQHMPIKEYSTGNSNQTISPQADNPFVNVDPRIAARAAANVVTKEISPVPQPQSSIPLNICSPKIDPIRPMPLPVAQLKSQNSSSIGNPPLKHPLAQSPPKSMPPAQMPIMNRQHIYSLSQNCPSLDRTSKEKQLESINPPSPLVQQSPKNNLNFILQNMQPVVELKRLPSASPTFSGGSTKESGPCIQLDNSIRKKFENQPPEPRAVDNVPAEIKSPASNDQSNKISETIPLKIEHATQQRIRLMQRRNSLCVADISDHQRNILNKFANSIRHNKLKVGDLLENFKKIYKKPNESSSSSSSSSSSDSDSSTSSSSSEKNSRKSRRHRKKKRSNKRSTKSDRSSESESSSSSSSSSSTTESKHTKRHQKRKSNKHSNNNRKKPIQIFDIETIKQNALMGCVEEIRRKNLMNQMSLSSNESYCASSLAHNESIVTTPNSHASVSPHGSEITRIPFVKLNRDNFIDTMAHDFDQHSVCSNNSTNRNKRSH